MNPNTFPTKGNLILAKNSLALARQGYDLMDKKRNILMREDHGIDQPGHRTSRARSIRRSARRMRCSRRRTSRWESIWWKRFLSPCRWKSLFGSRPEASWGTEIPLVEYKPKGQIPTYAFYSTTHSLDEAKIAFEKVKDLTIRLSMIENAAVPSCHQYQEDTEEGECAEEYYHPYV